jgi:hypothetical protein
MQYLLLIYDDESTWAAMPESERTHWYGQYMAFTNELRESGAFVAADQLESTSTAKTVAVRDGETITTDGPFAETKEQLGGYYLIEAATEDEAIAWAAKIPSAQFGRVEVRPLVQVPAEASA